MYNFILDSSSSRSRNRSPIYGFVSLFLKNFFEAAPAPVGSVSFGRIRIVTYENRSGTDPVSEKKLPIYKNSILFLKIDTFFYNIYE